MNVINFSGHPVVQNNLVEQVVRQGQSVDAKSMARFRSMVRTHVELFGEQSGTRDQTDI